MREKCNNRRLNRHFKAAPQFKSLEDLQRDKLKLRVASELEWSVDKLDVQTVCSGCYRGWTDCEQEDVDVIARHVLKANINDITIRIHGSQPSYKGYCGTWTWYATLSRPTYMCYDYNLTGFPVEDPVTCWDNLQDLLDQWINRPETIGLH